MSRGRIGQQTLMAREKLLLNAAMDIIMADGVEGLTMDKLVLDVPYSKGTVYGHFINKEDLLLALCNRGLVLLGRMLARAGLFDGNSREQVIALSFAFMLYSQIYPLMFMLIISAKSPGLMEKASTKYREEYLQLETNLSSGITGIIQQALTNGDCENPAGLDVKSIVFAIWSTSFGSITLLSKDVEQCSIRSKMFIEQALVININLILDSLHWHPFLSGIELSGILNRLKIEVFSTEIDMLKNHDKS